VAAVVAFGLLGLAASKEVRRAYFVLESDDGDYVFERQGVLPLQLSGQLAPVLKQMRGIEEDDVAQQMLDAQRETNRLLVEILTELRNRPSI
jgi:hypothetical protein